MKKLYYILFIVIGLIFNACSDYLDSDYLFDNRMSTEAVFKKKEYVDEWMARTYAFLGNDYLADVSSKGAYPFCFADDMYFGDRYDAYKSWKNGDYTEDGTLGKGSAKITDISSNIWSNCYKGIRQASVLINNIHINEDMTRAEIADYKAQAHFLRAYYYWLMLRLFGPIPILPNEGIDYMDDYDDVARPRNTYDECVEFITNELILAARDLPIDRDLLAIARPTRGAALALRAKVLLYAASPLMNGKAPAEIASAMVNDEGNPLLPTSYDESKWAKAAAAAKDVMDLNKYELHITYFRASGDIAFPATIVPPHDNDFSDKDWPNGWKDVDPFESYRSVFNGELGMSDNVELIFSRGQNHGDQAIESMALHQLPSVARGWNTHGLTMKQCDTYYMNDGSDCPGKDKEIGKGDGSDRLTGYVGDANHPNVDDYKPLATGVSMQFANREPRFYASVGYNGSIWNRTKETYEVDRNTQVFYYRGSGNGYTNSMFWLRTGIGVKKFIHPEDTSDALGSTGKIRAKAEPAIRYAEILLIYAEALNELDGSYDVPSWDGNKTHAIKRSIDEMKKGIHPIRIRGGVPDYKSDVYASKDEFRKKLKRERQIELMGEGHRFYDLRRWLDAPEEESTPIYGYNTLATKANPDLFHLPVAVPSLPTTFSKKMWFWPIHHTELRRNPRLTQNPGWTAPE
ncbi:MAG: RagB/SusD family nutrient uptake outer membrane protein [Dysgonomonas sp.]|nr:RagB/SusD family nutrient uptake outer membrane protein [Dysgonomonas sp.]